MTSVVIASTQTDKFQSIQPSTGTVGTVATLDDTYTVQFSQLQPSTSFVGTVGEHIATFTLKFSAIQPSTVKVGTGATGSAIVTSLPDGNSTASQIIVGTTASGSSIVFGMFDSAKPADMQVGTTATISAVHQTMFEGVQPSIFSRAHLNDGATTYNEFDAALFMTKAASGNANNKVRLIVDLGSKKRVNTVRVFSGQSDSSGNQKVKKLNVYVTDTAYTKTDGVFTNFSVNPGTKVGTIDWTTTTPVQQETKLSNS